MIFGDSWLQRLVVRGPSADAAAFRKAAIGSGRPEYLTLPQCHRRQWLSFVKLKAGLPRKAARRIEEKPEEPWDLSIDPPRRKEDGSTELVYAFQLSRFEPETLIEEVSKLYPSLCFVSGCVSPNVGERSSWFIHDGEVREWHLPERRFEALYRKMVPKETAENEDDVTDALDELDWAMMDAVVGHWDKDMARAMREVLPKPCRRTAGCVGQGGRPKPKRG